MPLTAAQRADEGLRSGVFGEQRARACSSRRRFARIRACPRLRDSNRSPIDTLDARWHEQRAQASATWRCDWRTASRLRRLPANRRAPLSVDRRRRAARSERPRRMRSACWRSPPTGLRQGRADVPSVLMSEFINARRSWARAGRSDRARRSADARECVAEGQSEQQLARRSAVLAVASAGSERPGGGRGADAATGSRDAEELETPGAASARRAIVGRSRVARVGDNQFRNGQLRRCPLRCYLAACMLFVSCVLAKTS